MSGSVLDRACASGMPGRLGPSWSAGRPSIRSAEALQLARHYTPSLPSVSTNSLLEPDRILRMVICVFHLSQHAPDQSGSVYRKCLPFAWSGAESATINVIAGL